MTVVLRRASDSILGFDEMDESTKRTLDQVQQDEDKAPHLVAGCEVRRAFLCHTSDGQSKASQDYWPGNRKLHEPMALEPGRSECPEEPSEQHS